MGVKVYSIEVLREPKVGAIFSGEEGMKVKVVEPRFKQKDGNLFPTKRKLVKKMILESIVKSLSSLFLSSRSSNLITPKCQIPSNHINDLIKGSDIPTINVQ